MSAEVQYITDDKGEKKGVIMNISDYQSLMEDIEDLAACAERRHEATIPHEEFLKELEEDGIL
jgi:PHD/YefM family antitoxin component YafN of YafNO toxin-antitoxin module